MYALVHDGKVYGPSGPIADVEGVRLEAEHATEYNNAVEAQEIEYIRNGPAWITAYVGKKYTNEAKTSYQWRVTNWLGSVLCRHAYMGDRQYIGFGGSYRRSMSAFIMGRWYNGWYMESSGDYCRLKLAKHSPFNKRDANEPILGPWDWRK